MDIRELTQTIQENVSFKIKASDVIDACEEERVQTAIITVLRKKEEKKHIVKKIKCCKIEKADLSGCTSLRTVLTKIYGFRASYGIYDDARKNGTRRLKVEGNLFPELVKQLRKLCFKYEYNDLRQETFRGMRRPYHAFYYSVDRIK